MSERSGNHASGSGPCGRTAESLRAAGYEAMVRVAYALVCARTRAGDFQIHGNTRGTGVGIRQRPRKNQGEHFIAWSTTKRTWPAAILCRHLTRQHCSPRTGWEISRVRCGAWDAGIACRSTMRSRFHIHWGCTTARLPSISGFLKFGDEYKVMGLAAYGSPENMEAFRDIVRFSPNGGEFGFRLGLDYFTHHKTGPEMSWAESDKTPVLGKMFSEEMGKTIGRSGTIAGRAVGTAAPEYGRIAASAAGRSLFRDAEKIGREDRAKAVCLSGGVAFNCVANGKFLMRRRLKSVYVHPAAGDAGLAVGAAFYIWNQVLGKPRSFVMEHAYWGPGVFWAGNSGAIQGSAVSKDGYKVSAAGRTRVDAANC